MENRSFHCSLKCDRVRMIIRLLALFLFLQVSLAEPKDLECKRKSAKICQLDFVIWGNNQKPKFPDLSSKHTLVIRSGSIAEFSKTLVSQLGSVTKVQLGQLGITSLFISPQWTSLKAEFNQISELHIEELVDVGDSTDHIPKTFNERDTNEEVERFVNQTSAIGNPKDESDEALNATEVPEVPLADTPFIDITVNALVFLNLANNRLKSVDNLKFLSKLKELLLDGNRIEFIKMGTFAGMRNLKKLSLANNKINRIVTPEPTSFLALEKLSLAFNQLTKLDVQNWAMSQLTHLDVSHNKLTAMDVTTLDQFVSLEKLAMANNSWHCEWLSVAVKDFDRSFVQLEDAQETCPKDEYELKGFCCKYFQHSEDDSINTFDRIKRMEEANKMMKQNFHSKVELFKTEWMTNAEALQQKAMNKLKPYEELDKKMQKDDNKEAQKAMENLSKLIEDCNDLLEKVKNANEHNKQYTQRFTSLFYTTLAEKNKLVQEMTKAATLEEEMKKYEMSFKANN
ncbi:uncharacterized protein LOC109418115 [Aedes albopictus]|uniref:Leucine-rich immune protein (Short) n=1 Tax=Aedes albopictus TaxID=7160 RepID=A0ABM1XRE8_AEDAL|nr:uncharacterized protein LOC109418115 [Aedes albopictus]